MTPPSLFPMDEPPIDTGERDQMKLRQMQAAYDDNLPLKPHKDDK